MPSCVKAFLASGIGSLLSVDGPRILSGGSRNLSALSHRPIVLPPLPHTPPTPALTIHFFFLAAAPEAYGGSQARDQIGATAGAYTTATATPDLSHICDLNHSLQQ